MPTPQSSLWKPKPLFGADWISAPASAAGLQPQPRADYLTAGFGNQTQAPIEAPITPFFAQQNQLLNQLNAPATKITAPVTTTRPAVTPERENYMTATDPWNWEYSGGDFGAMRRVRPAGDVSNYQNWYADKQKAIEENNRLYPWMANIPSSPLTAKIPNLPDKNDPTQWYTIKAFDLDQSKASATPSTVTEAQLENMSDYEINQLTRLNGPYSPALQALIDRRKKRDEEALIRSRQFKADIDAGKYTQEQRRIMFPTGLLRG